MKLARALSEAEAKNVQSFILLSGVLTTLAIWTKLEDPINLPKMFVLVLSSAIVLGLVFSAILSAKKFASITQRIGLLLIGGFALGLLTATVATDVKYTAIFGEYHRNNGFLSYLAMIILMGAGSLVFSLKSASRYLTFFGIAGLVLSFYGILQGLGADPVGWKLDYNPFITTLGNPNFTSGFLGLSGIAIFLLAIEAKDRKVQISWTIGLFADLYILKLSGSIQGLFGFLLGAAIIILVKLWLINRKYGQIGLVATAITGAPVGLAILNIGPLASSLYQSTLANRLDYWNAALNMFKDYPIFGVGIDRYSEYYRQYAVQNQVVQGQITDNAHSVYLQLLATGGLITFVPYVALIFFVTYIGLKALFGATGPTKLRIGGILGIWLGTVAVNIVAIDNLGVAVWFWITGGVLISVSVSSTGQAFDSSNYVMQAQDRNVKMGRSATKGGLSANNKKPRSGSSTEFPVTTIIASGFAIIIFLTLLPILGRSQAINELNLNSKGYDANTYVAELNKQVSNNQNNSQNLILLADVALRQGEIDLAYKINDRIRELDPRSFYGHYLPALAYEASSKPAEAIKFREKLIELDPWNSSNVLQLIKDYLLVGNRESAAEIAALLKQNYPGSQADIDASALLVG
jgi:O-antigen ligase